MNFQYETDLITDSYGEKPITVRVNNRLRSTAGKAWAARREIQIAGWLLKADEKQQRETLMHEIAHVMAGDKAGHNKVWKSFARMLGSTGNRCYSSAELGHLTNREVMKVYYRCKAGVCEIKGRRKLRKNYALPVYECRAHGENFVPVS